jgi:hypothetical protein
MQKGYAMRAALNKLLGKFGYQLSRAYGIPVTYRFLTNYDYFSKRYAEIGNVPGDIVECGVGFGHSMLALLMNAQREGKGRVMWGFDSFEGFPEPTTEDTSPRNPKKGEWKHITPAILDDILFRRCGVPQSMRTQLKLVPGFFDATLPKANLGPIALLHLDVDLYGSYKTCLEQLYRNVVPGGLILLDEYKQGNMQDVFPGAAKAIDEFLADKPEKPQFDTTAKKYYLIKQ